MIDVLENLGHRALGGVVLVLLPVFGYLIISLIWKVPRLRVFTRVPVLARLAGVAGILLGLGVVYANDRRPSLKFSDIFEEDGAWDVDWWVFLTEIGDPALYTYDGLWAVLAAPEQDSGLYLFTLLLLGAIGLSLAAVLVLLRGLDVVVGLLGVALIILLSQALTSYAVTLAAYALNTFNFWIALIALGILQYYRHKNGKTGH